MGGIFVGGIFLEPEQERAKGYFIYYVASITKSMTLGDVFTSDM